MEAYATTLLYGGLAIAALAWIWLIVRAFQQKPWWGISCLFLPPTALLFASRHAQKAMTPLLVGVLGGFATATPIAYSLAGPHDLALREKFRAGPKLWSLAAAGLQTDSAHQWMEGRALYMLLGGVTLAVLAWVWLIARAFRQDRRWGWSSLVVPPTGLAFTAFYPRKGLFPLVLLFLGLLIAAAPALFTLFVPLDLGPIETIVDGQRHLTLTGWDRRDYSILRLKPDVVVLQMANPDVTDETLKELESMKDLQELDLSGTQVTDEGLKILKTLPALSRLRLARTRISDQGFHDTLFDKYSLIKLDLSGTQVRQETVQNWRKARSGR
jgi:hypothetical protein